MRLLNYYYHMHLQFEQTVTEHHFKLRCFPMNDEHQKIFNEDIRIMPVHFSSSGTDSFGNMCIYGTYYSRRSIFIEEGRVSGLRAYIVVALQA